MVHTVLEGRSCQEMVKRRGSPATHPLGGPNGRTGGEKARACWRGTSPSEAEGLEREARVLESRVPSAGRGPQDQQHPQHQDPRWPRPAILAMTSVRGGLATCLANLSYYLKKPYSWMAQPVGKSLPREWSLPSSNTPMVPAQWASDLASDLVLPGPTMALRC